MSPRNIDGVVAAFDEILEETERNRSALGYFPALYRGVTLQVRRRIAAGGYFDDDGRMERMIVLFADRYFDAYRRFRAGGEPSRCWRVALEAGRLRGRIILQHLVLGINAHVNLDLGIAAASVAPGDRLPGFEADFNRINDVLFSMVDEVGRAVGRLSPWIRLLDWLGKERDELFVKFSLGAARRSAWRLATELAALPVAVHDGPIGVRDLEVAALARYLRRLGPLGRIGVATISVRESRDVAGNIAVLREATESAT